MQTNRLVVVGVVGAIAGFALQGCFAAQPLPECNVIRAQAGLGVGPYAMKFTKIDGTCTAMTTGQMGMERYHPPDTNDFTIGFRFSPLIDMVNGGFYFADYDTTNDCSDGQNCDMCLAANDPACTADPACNVCQLVPDGVPRTDPNDPDGKNLFGKAKISAVPDKDGVCTMSDFTGNTQTFQAESISLIDGGTQDFPAGAIKFDWPEFKLYSTARVPGTAFKAKLKFTEGNCVANYDVLGIWPPVSCAVDVDCDPVADFDAGRLIGSGINPDFKPKCDKAIGVCMPTVDVATLK